MTQQRGIAVSKIWKRASKLVGQWQRLLSKWTISGRFRFLVADQTCCIFRFPAPGYLRKIGLHQTKEIHAWSCLWHPTAHSHRSHNLWLRKNLIKNGKCARKPRCKSKSGNVCVLLFDNHTPHTMRQSQPIKLGSNEDTPSFLHWRLPPSSSQLCFLSAMQNNSALTWFSTNTNE